MLSNLRLVLSVDVQPGDQHNVKHATSGLWSLLDRWQRGRWPRLLLGDLAWGIGPNDCFQPRQFAAVRAVIGASS